MTKIRNLIIEDMNYISDGLKESEKQIMKMLEDTSISQAVAVSENKEIVSSALSWHNKWHPYAEYIRLFTDQSRSDCAENSEQLLDHLYTHAVKDKVWHLQYPLDSRDQETADILELNGFSLFRRTYEPSIEIKQLNKEYRNIKPHPNTRTLKEIIEDEKLSKEFFELTTKVYDAGHIDNPRGSRSLNEEKETYLSYPVDIMASLVGFSEEGEIDSYIMLFEPEEQSVEFGWAGASSDTKSECLRQLFKSVINDLQRKDIQLLEPEIDTTDYYQYKVLFSFLKFQHMDSWNAYKKILE